MDIYDSSLIKIMCKDQYLKDKGITEDLLEECVMRAMNILESKTTNNYRIQNAIKKEEESRRLAVIAEKEARELIESSLMIKNNRKNKN